MTKVAFVGVALGMVCAGVWNMMIRMPEPTHYVSAPTADDRLKNELRRHVQTLAGDIGERHLGRPERLDPARIYLEAEFHAKRYAVRQETFETQSPHGQQGAANLVIERRGVTSPDDIVVVGARYDSAVSSPGADDNASGVAAVLALAGAWAERSPAKTLRFVLFANEEPPYYHTSHMGSLVNARASRARHERISGMLSLETIGYYSPREGSQQYPFPFSLLYPSRGSFIGFVGNVQSRALVRRVVDTFRRHSRVESEGVAAPSWIRGVDWSDQWSFWEQGYPALMVTDTALFRNPNYHRPTDLPASLDYERLGDVVVALDVVLADLVSEDSPVTASMPTGAR